MTNKTWNIISVSEKNMASESYNNCARMKMYYDFGIAQAFFSTGWLKAVG